MGEIEAIYPSLKTIKIRRRTFTTFQKLLLHCAWITAVLGSGVSVIMLPPEASGAVFWIMIFGPVTLGLALALGVGLCPAGPEKEFVVDAMQNITGDTNFSAVEGQITFDGGVKNVSIIVPTVYGTSLGILDPTPTAYSTGPANAETADWALELARQRFPNACWVSPPIVRPAVEQETERAQKGTGH